MTVHIIHADVLAGLAQLESDSVNTVVTSPPYHGMRDYGTGTWEGGDAGCEHVEQSFGKGRGDGKFYDGGKPRELEGGRPILGPICKCGARRIDDQIGLEPTLAEHIDKLVQVFAEVRRVLRPDGVCFLNYGDAYAAGHGGSTTAGNYTPKTSTNKPANPRKRDDVDVGSWSDRDVTPKRVVAGMKPKDLMLIPERLSIRLQEAGWWVRDRIIWHKPNPMPSSVTDRCTPSYELVYMLTKKARYWWDAEAIREPYESSEQDQARAKVTGRGLTEASRASTGGPQRSQSGGYPMNGSGRNARNVWTIATAPFPSAHFATFAPKLVEKCLLAACPERVCASCGAGWVREVERGELVPRAGRKTIGASFAPDVDRRDDAAKGWTSEAGMTPDGYRPTKTLGWHPSCTCQAETRPGTCLDPFGGSGTVGLVADRMNRDATMIELSAEYVAMARKRIEGDAPLFADLPEHEPAPQPAEQGGLFDEG